MPISSLNIANTISEDQLAPHLRTRGGGTTFTAISQTGAEAPPFITATATRDFRAGQAVHLINNSFILASPTADNLATAVIAFNCIDGDTVKAKLNGEIITDYVHGFAPGTNLYLIKKTSDSTDFNLSNILTANELINGQFVQFIGTAGENQTIYVNIAEALQLSI